MLTVFAILIANSGLLLILYLIWQEEKADSGEVEQRSMAAVAVVVSLVGVWQVISNLSTSAPH